MLIDGRTANQGFFCGIKQLIKDKKKRDRREKYGLSLFLFIYL